ncbi:uncharacterized protein [Epargyreus clarus]|uniref:uncharacterized protein n=1 Tax=Epargyreus clarus TaxID=520877 RepID=UPI003C2FB882
MSEQVDCITRAVTKTRIAVSTVTDLRYNNIDKNSSRVSIEIREFEELSTVFNNIKECSKLFNKIYGLQLVMMLGLATAYCIMFMYTMAFLSVKGYTNVGSLISSILKLLMYFLLLLLLSMGAQKKQNSVNNLPRQLGKLLINHVINDAHYKATKDFLRLVSTRSIMTETLGSIHVDMTLIPSFIMFVTSYTVIALQFNNIV